MKFLKIAGKDIKSIAQNRFIRVSVIAILIVPLLYSLLYLYAFWDPYAKLADVPVAVVNKDKGTTMDGDKVNYGEDVAEELRGNEELGWQITDDKDAWDGLDGDKYYAVVEIPENFSKDVVAAKDGTPKIADITFTCNDKKNFLAAQINSKVQSELKANITKTISNNYVTVAFDSLYKAKDGFVAAEDGSKQIKDGLKTLNDKVPEMSGGISKLVDGSNDLNNAQKQVSNAQVQLNDGQVQLSNGQKQLNNGLLTLNNGQTEFNKGVNDLNGGIAMLNSKVPELSTGVGTLDGGVQKLYGGFNASILPGVKSLRDGLSTLNNSLGSGKEDIDKLSAGAKAVEQNTPNLIKGTNDIKAVEPKLTEGYSQIQKGSSQLNAGVSQVVSGATETSGEVQNIGENITEMLKANPSLAKDPNMQEVLKSLNNLNNKKPQTEAGLSQLAKGANDLNNGVVYFNENGLKPYIEGVNTLADSTAKYAQGSNQVAQGTNKLINNVGAVANAVGQLSAGSNTLYEGLDYSNKDGFGYGLASVAKGTATLNSKVPELQSGSNALVAGSNTLRDASGKLLAGTKGALVGSNKLVEGQGLLVEGQGKLVEVQGQIVDGQDKLNDGLHLLDSSIPELSDGVTKLYDGTNELNTKLGEGTNEMKNGLVNSSEVMGEFVSQPLDLKSESINKVSNYGTGFAPYFIPLSLWIGAIMMFFVIPTKVDDEEEASKFDKVFGKYLSFGIVGVLQAILVSAVVVGFLGLRPTSIVAFVLTNVFLSLVFISIIQCLIFLLGDAGRLLGIVLLILQLTACAGTFPLEVVPTFFKVINPFMPFTYAVEALREVISATTINYSVLGKDFIILATLLVVFLGISVLLKNKGEALVEKIEGRKAA